MRFIVPFVSLLASVILTAPLCEAQSPNGPFIPSNGWNNQPGNQNPGLALQTIFQGQKQSVWNPANPATMQQPPQRANQFNYPSSLLAPYRDNGPAIRRPNNNGPMNNVGFQNPGRSFDPQGQTGQLPPAANGFNNSQQPLATPQASPNADNGGGYGNGWNNQAQVQGGRTNEEINLDQSYFDPACGESCGECDIPCCGPTGYWFGGLAGLAMYRDYESNTYLTYWPSDPRNNVLSSRDAETGSLGGYEATIGRAMCNGWAWGLTYWGLAPDSATATVGGMPLTRLMGMSYLNYTAAGFGIDTVFGWYNNAATHRITRENEFHSLELNFYRGGCSSLQSYGGYNAIGSGNCCEPNCCAPCPCWDLQWLAGIRYFRFDEFFQYASSVPGGYTYSPRELYYDIDTQNELFGFQVGGLAQRAFGCRWSVFGGTKLGIYNNRISHSSSIYGPSGGAVVNTGSYAGTIYNVNSHKDDLSFMGEFNAGVRFQFARCWRATLGYRAAAMTGVALAPNQIPYDFSYIPGVRAIDTDGSLVLHGAFLGVEFRR